MKLSLFKKKLHYNIVISLQLNKYIFRKEKKKRLNLLIIYFWLGVLDLRCCVSFSLVAASKGYSACGAWAPHCGGSCCCRAQALGHWSALVVYGPGCSTGCGVFPDQGSNPSLPHWQVGSLSLSHRGSPVSSFSVSSDLLLASLWNELPPFCAAIVLCPGPM